MKRNQILLLLIILVSAPGIFAQQTSWQWVNPLPQGNILNGVWNISADTVIAVGDFGTVLKSTNGGRTWQVTPNAAGAIEVLYAVQFISSSTGWSVGETGRILKTTDAGATWFQQNSGTYRDLYSVSFVSPMVGWAAGSLGAILSTTDGGITWISQTSGTSSSFYAAYFQNSTTGFVGGTNGTVLGTTNGGNSWVVKNSGTTQNIYSIQFVNSSVGYVAGSFGLISKTTNGGNNWVSQISGTDFSLYGIQFTSALIGYAIGSYGIIIKTTNGGFSWFEQPGGTYNDLFALRFISSTTGWAVGDFGTIVSTTDGGTTWIQQSTGVKSVLTAIHFPTGSFGVAVGEEGTVIRSNDGGSTWTQFISGVFQTLYGVYMVNESVGWAVGDSSVILKTTNGGYSWTKQSNHSDVTLYSAYFINSTTGWVAGDLGMIYKTTNGGTAWTAESTQVSTPLLRVKFFDANVGWAVGYGGEIVKTINGGLTWESQISDTYQTLYSLDIINSSTVACVGDFGTVVTTADGGATWSSQNSNTSSSLYGVVFLSSLTGWAAGDEGTVMRTDDGGVTWNSQNTRTLNTLWDIQLIRSTSGGGFLFATGIGGTIVCSGVSPLQQRTWTGAFDSLWTNAGNWYPTGVPQKGDSIYIPVTTHNPIYKSFLQQANLAGCTIAPDATLTIGEGLAQLVISGNVRIEGTLAVEGNSTLEIISGGIFSFGMKGNLIPAHSTLMLTSGGQIRGSFFNIYIAESTNVRSIGNIEIKNNLTIFSDISTRQIDTVTILNPEPQGFQGPGLIKSGTIERLIKQGTTYEYRFESPLTFLKFYPTGTLPDTVTMTVYPNAVPPGLPDTAFVKRYYNISAHGGDKYLAYMSLRYDTSETSIPIYDLGFFRDSSDIIFNVGATDYIDSDYVSITLDSVSNFSKWYIGKSDFQWKHPLQFTDTLTITDNGSATGMLYFGTAPGATDWIDPLYGESQLFPKPPAGTFDVRWTIPTTNGLDLDIRDILKYSHQQILYSGTIQTGPGGYPVTLRWDNAIFPTGTAILRDALTGGSVFSVDMRNQKTFTITNPVVKSFEILYTSPSFYTFKKGWNMVSIPTVPFGSNKKTSIFPNAISKAFGFTSFYYNADTLSHGIGYWIKFENLQNVGIDGIPISIDTLHLHSGWNMIGAVKAPVPVAPLTSIPPNLIVSKYFYYDGAYQMYDTLKPARGYWVKTSQAGDLILKTTAALDKQTALLSFDDELQKFNKIAISDRDGNCSILYFSSLNDSAIALDHFELPPPPPSGSFDVRFASQRYAEILPKESQQLIIKLQSSAYPVTITWQSKQLPAQSIKLVNTENGSHVATLFEGGTARISDPRTSSITIKAGGTKSVPAKFSLGQNYPNPFNPSTSIEFVLPVRASVTIKIFNLLGQEVGTLIDNLDYDAGIHTVDMNTGNMGLKNVNGSGVYFYRFTGTSGTQNFSDVRKMIFLK